MNLWSWVAAAATTAAVLAARPAPVVVARVRLGVAREAERHVAPVGRPLVVVLCCVALLALARDPAACLAAATAVGVGLFAWGRWRADRRRRAGAASRSHVAASLDLLAAEMRAGVLPLEALRGVAHEVPVLAPVASAVQSGADPTVALQVVAQEPGAEALADLAAAWSLADRAGVPLSDVLERLAASVRDDVDLGREVRAEAAPARATGRLMAVLPVLGLGLGAGLGSDPLVLLTRTVPGALCLAAGAALACAGTAWIDRLADAAEDPS